jgi:hypothetical protein
MVCRGNAGPDPSAARQGGDRTLYCRRMRSRLLPLGALALALAYLAVSVPRALRETGLRLRWAAATAGLSAGDVRQLVFGEPYVAAVEQIRRAIPVHEPYLLAERDPEGSILWVRFDLLPRRAIVVREAGSAAPAPLAHDCLVDQLRWKVVGVSHGRPPLLLERRPTVPPGCPPAIWVQPGLQPVVR